MSPDLERIASQKERRSDIAMAVFASELGYARQDLSAIKGRMDDLSQNYATLDRFEALKQRVSQLEKAVYGVAALIIFAVLAALVALVVHR